ncbi:MAG: hypothetical protein JXA38_06040 [Methanosarcinaceae archaeon]|nr:hypothetical protein [Methanosarcinaceae archaeon]
MNKKNNLFLAVSKMLYSLTHIQKEENPYASIDDWNIYPSSPSSGDILDIKGKTRPGENIGMKVSFTMYLPVIDNEYSYVFENIKIPDGSNSFMVRTQKVKDLNFIVRMFIDFKRTFEADNGVAEFFEKNVPAGNYEVVIQGTANNGENEVRADFIATQIIKADEEGNFFLKYDTSILPKGEFTVKIGENEKTVTLI